ncbi:MAG: hypothetical protein ABF735_04675 [Lentilactobacillus hilgardii]
MKKQLLLLFLGAFMGIAISNHQPVQAKTTYIHVSKSSLKDDRG